MLGMLLNLSNTLGVFKSLINYALYIFIILFTFSAFCLAFLNQLLLLILHHEISFPKNHMEKKRKHSLTICIINITDT